MIVSFADGHEATLNLAELSGGGHVVSADVLGSA
jgi:hypothetical protein